MNYQKILKGICNISREEAKQMLKKTGILCNWWRNVNELPTDQIVDKLTERNIEWHLSRYNEFDPLTGELFHKFTPFISTTAGGIERDPANGVNLAHSAFLTALSFATECFTKEGVVFYGFLNVVGRKTVKFREFAEETRELNIWRSFQPYHPEGEILAKISIPPPRLEKAEAYDGPVALSELSQGRLPTPTWAESNAGVYAPPEEYSNVRNAIL